MADYQKAVYQKSKVDRKKDLQSHYGFECSCPACEETDRGEVSKYHQGKLRGYLLEIEHSNSKERYTRDIQRVAIRESIDLL